MKFLFILLLCIAGFIHCTAQSVKHVTNPKAKLLDDSAVHKFMNAKGDPGINKEVIHLLEMAVKTDSNYFEGWINLMTFQCKTDQFENGLKTAKRMNRIFPDQTDVLFNCGILEYKTGRGKEALATFEQLYKIYNAVPALNTKSPNYKAILINKGITLILSDKPAEGKKLLKKLYDEEQDGYVKSYIAFYVNSSKEQIIEDKVPGK